MQNKKIIFLIALGIIIIVVLFISILTKPHQYQSTAYGFSFNYPNSWNAQLIAASNGKQMIFSDQAGQSVMQLFLGQRDFSELGTVISAEDYATNDVKTPLHFQIQRYLPDGSQDTAVIIWQKNCLSLPCALTEDSGGILTFSLSNEPNKRAALLQEIATLIKSFKLL